MAELVETVVSLENAVERLLHTLEHLRQANARLEETLDLMQKENQSQQHTIMEWEEKYNSLKMASAMLGSHTSKTEAKLKINTLIRELDICIAKLAG